MGASNEHGCHWKLTHALINGETSNLINDTIFLRVWCLYVKLLGLKQENRQSIQSFYQLQMKTIQKLKKMHKMR